MNKQPLMTKPQWLRVVLWAIALVLAALGLSAWRPPSPLIDQPLPAFVLPVLGDSQRMVRHDDLLGQVWLLNVWASWCPNCRQEHSTLLRLADEGVTIVGLHYEEEADAGLSFLQQEGNPYYLSLVDEEGDFTADLRVRGIPATFVIDAAGIIRHRHIGILSEEDVSQWLGK